MIRLALPAVVLSLSGCLAFPCKQADRSRISLEQNQVAPDSDEKLREGDKTIVYTRKGQTDEYKIVRLEDGGFVGEAWDHKRYRVLYKNLDRMWVERRKWTLCMIPLR
jgi:hypothetical protein